MKKPVVFLLLAGLALAIAFILGPRVPGIGELGATVDNLRAWRADHAVAVSLAFFGVYVGATALSLPFAAILTIVAGALFGFWWGLILVSFASSIGATLAFLVARYLLRDWVRAKLGDRADRIDRGLERDGAFYLFTLRLIPAVPFFAVNLLMGLTPIPAFRFYWVSQIGMLAGTAVYVNAGTQLARVDDMGSITSPALLLSFAALGLFPWIARWGVGILRRRRVYSGWTRPDSFDRNLIVIGAGSAGLVTSYIAAATRAKVTLVEAAEMGGDCLNTGCVPSKTLIRSARAAHDVRTSANYGIEAEPPHVDFPRVMERVARVIRDIAPHDSVERYTGLGVDVVRGYGRIVGPWTVEIATPDGDTRRLTARSIVIATGAAPVVPPIPGLAEVGCLTSETLWDAMQGRPAAPQRMVVLGGGPIGAELAQAFQRLGSAVTLVEMAPRILPREDEEAAALVHAALERDGVTLLTRHKAVAAGRDDGGRWIDVEGSDGTTSRIACDEIVAALGRKPRLEGFGLEDLGVPTDGVVETNEFLETRFPNIFAAGDVAGPYQFTHVAGHQGWYAAVNALFGNIRRFRVDYRVIPWATFTDPEVARVGLSPDEARERKVAHEVTRYDIGDLDRAIAEGTDSGFVKIVTAKGSDRILGVTLVGSHAGDLIAEFVLAMKHGLGLNKVLGTIHIYPTSAEAAKAAAGVWRQAHVNQRLLSFVERYHDRRRK